MRIHDNVKQWQAEQSEIFNEAIFSEQTRIVHGQMVHLPRFLAVDFQKIFSLYGFPDVS